MYRLLLPLFCLLSTELVPCLSSSALAVDSNPTGTIHVLGAIEEFDPKVGSSCKASWTRLKKFLQAARPDIKRLAIHYYWDRVAGRSDVITFFDTNNFKPNDVLWFYYCGHGMTVPGQGHVLQMGGDRLSRKELRAAMEAKKTQGVLITTDACGTRAEPQPGPVLNEGGAPPEGNWSLIADIIGDLHGTVDITAATGENPAFVDTKSIQGENGPEPKGAVFTEAIAEVLSQLPESLDTNHDGIADWTEVFFAIRESTHRRFTELRSRYAPLGWRRLAGNVEDQVPYAFFLPKEIEVAAAAAPAPPPAPAPFAEALPLAPATPQPPPLVRLKLAFRKWDEEGMRFFVTTRLDPSLVGTRIEVGISLRDTEGKPLSAARKEYSDEVGGLVAKKNFLVARENLISDQNHPLIFSLPNNAHRENEYPDSFVLYAFDVASRKNFSSTTFSFSP